MIKNLAIDLENCYGIGKLKHTFSFDEDNRTYAIYAPNGSMKTSFAKTLLDYSQGKDSSDIVFKERKTKRVVTEDGNGSLEPEQVFVLEPYNDAYVSEKTSTLLVNKDLKKKYDDIWSKVEALKDNLVDELKKASGMRTGVEDELSVTIMSSRGLFIKAMKRVKDEVLEDKDPIFSKVEYKTVFNEKVIKFLSDDKLRAELKEYIDRYDELVEKSKYFRKGVFNHTNAATVVKSLVANGFFEASHSVSLSDESDSNKSEISSQAELEAVIQKEMEEILNDEKLLKAFEKIDKKLTNQELKSFRDYLVLHKDLIPELGNLPGFRDKVWVDYLKVCKEAYRVLIDTYEQAEKDLQQIEEQAKKEQTQWLQVVATFNERFNVPFNLTVKNQQDVILKRELPVLGFEFKDGADSQEVDEGLLRTVLSNGEKKALYILNLLFEIEARKSEDLETLLIIDDIADSFDYKNKYAIIEYLKDNVDHGKFYQIILTHNFDFFRTIQSRFPVSRDYCLMVDRTANGLELVKAEYVKDPFGHFLKHTTNDSMLLSLIPFMRNLIEYTKGESDPQFAQLTSVLHQKPDTPHITKKDINEIINELFPNNTVTLSDPTKVVATLFIEKAEELLPKSENLMLENKIVLSVAIRLKAEEFLISHITDKSFILSIQSNQTPKLIEKYAEENPKKLKELSVFKRVNLITPQNIHLNSFMYEPILDMSDVELKDLYRDVSSLKLLAR